ncbi:protein eyes shut homolog isoform X3 [Silurus meridionalis]|uniref:protein eyes shut homolog isoform X3 n=1 Tax=Silurus meridionalis TaxID=175797 RepID=UPI001EEC3154|nr:protein eyes shut homolog isoform X3 [Silurus meridionalis]
MNMTRSTAKKTKLLKLLLLVSSHFFVTSQLLCRRPRYRVWRPQPGNITLRLSLMENTCRNVNHCWNGISERARAHLMDKSYAFPQLCPVEVQLGDTLLAFTDPMLEQYGINLVNVSKEEFDSCFTEQKQKQHLFAGYMNGSLQVASKWLSPGVHYFAATHEGSRHLCHLGLRFSVLVKEQLCQNSPGRHLCSGKGVCRAQTGQFAYGCQCPKPYSEPYCDAVDMCSGGPCQNGANCLSSHAAHQSQASYQCLCPSLFTGVNCSKILGQNNCIRRCRNGICLQVSPNSFHCECFDGFTGTFCSEKKNPMSKSKGEKCDEKYICMCPEGSTGYTCEVMLEHNCTALDSLKEDDDSTVKCVCSNGRLCFVDSISSHSCICAPGWTRLINVNDCTQHRCQNGATCVNKVAGYSVSEDQQHYICFCQPRYTGVFCEIKTDECKSSPCANGATCMDIVASYWCPCAAGFEDKNCSAEVADCTFLKKPGENNAVCYIENGDFYCRCPPGLTGRFCEIDIDDCASEPCGAVSICEDGIAAYRCFCAPGFIGNYCEIEVNECLSHPCQNGASCLDKLDSFSCICPDGLSGTLCEIDINECLSSPCQHEGTCLDLTNGFVCICPLGFTGPMCEVDIDECSSSPCENACRDQPDNYQCQCVDPFKGIHCELLPCEASNPCENGAKCVEEADLERFPLGFHCHCLRGFTGPRCELNVDECDSNPCVHGFCYDVVDGYYCLCNPGYAGVRCEQDIDDCLGNACENNSTCVDFHLSYQCVCDPGWEGELCQIETNECAPNPCRNNGTCTDLLNSYRCLCPRGWTGPDCIEAVWGCVSSPCFNGALCVESDDPIEFFCTCPPFFTGSLCAVPYDPCDVKNNPCLNNSTCRSTPDGSAECLCPSGIEGSHCDIDTDECESSPCRNHGHCVDMVNNYYCNCTPGFSGLHCEEDIDECASNPCQNRGICQDLVHSFRCSCLPGYSGPVCNLVTKPCEASSCLHDGVCINKPRGFVCVCRPGYTGTWCELIVDKCASNPCQNGGRCVDGPDGYQCFCPDGFSDSDCGNNIDDCASDPCVHGSCSDAIDAYDCRCESGWSGPRCDTNVDECASQPCLNAGSCVDLVDEYTCICTKGYNGPRCEVDLDACMDAPVNSSYCFNGGTCLDGPGYSFTCRCPAGFAGDFCELDVNECCSEPCFHAGVCQDLINGYRCHCRPGWTGLRCEDDINECLPQPCNQGMCIQNEPGQGYSCFCQPGFVGRNCEYNYDDCLLWPCPDGFTCVDGVNSVSCVAVETNVTSSPAVFLTRAEQAADISYGRYSGASFLEFEHIHLSAVSNITVRFQTRSVNGTILFVDQPFGCLFLKLYLNNGILQYDFSCSQNEGIHSINTKVQVNDGKEYLVHIRQSLAPCEADVAVSGFRRAQSNPNNYRPGVALQTTARVFVGGLPLNYSTKKGAEPLYNYTGCIEIIEINKHKGFHTSSAIAGNNTGDCKSSWQQNSLADAVVTSDVFGSPRGAGHLKLLPTMASLACSEEPCLNGGTCHRLSMPSGAASFFCNCPLNYTGRLCEKETSIRSPLFSGSSYLELQPLTSLDTGFENTSSRPPLSIQLTVKVKALDGILLYTEEQKFGGRFLHVFLQDGYPGARLGCSSSDVLESLSSQKMDRDTVASVIVRYWLPVSRDGGLCVIEVAATNGTANRSQKYVSEPSSEIVFGPTFLGGVPSTSFHGNTGNVSGFVGCILELRVNSRELHVMEDALRGQNIQNCDTAVCQHQPCRNGGTCISDTDTWLCVCPPLFSGKLCQFATCERNPCAHGATCIPKSPLEAVCLCPHGRQGLLCDQAIRITRPRFSGLDEFGFPSYMAYPPISSMSYFYEFRLKLVFSNNSTAMKNNLILFSGQKGQGITGDDFFALGVRNRRIIYKFNLGSGVASIISDPLSQRARIHTVHFGRYLRNGWMKVDGQRNKTGSSPGKLAALTTFSPLYMGGYSEHVPEMLPLGARFDNSFQGCIYNVQFRTRYDGKFHTLTNLETPPIAARSVGQCGVSPCSLLTCHNGGTCIDSGSSVYCQCGSEWKGALCSERVSFCDLEHIPPPSCARGSTCVMLPEGYSCQCPLGTSGKFCQEALSISDPFFKANWSSWMAFPLIHIRQRTHIVLQFKTISLEGILFYAAQYVGTHAGDFISLSLSGGFVQLRYNLGDTTIVLQSTNKVDLMGCTWHTVKAGREGNQGYLVLDEQSIIRNTSKGMTSLDISSEIFIGGVSMLNFVSPDAVEEEPIGFSGSIREVIVNGHELELTEKGALRGVNVKDWDGTKCGYKVCKNKGYCQADSHDSFVCLCPAEWTGTYCEQSIYCEGATCQHGSICIPNITSATYSCTCGLGWQGTHCEQRVSTQTIHFVGNSYLKYKDPKYSTRDLTRTHFSFNLSVSSGDGLILWMGLAKSENDDYLAVGLQDGHLKLAINLGERIAVPLVSRNTTLCCNEWKYLSITLDRTIIQAYVEEKKVIFEDIDPFEHYVSMNYGAVYYFGGFEMSRDVGWVTSGLFTTGFVGSIKDVLLYQDTSMMQILEKAEGFNVFQVDD